MKIRNSILFLGAGKRVSLLTEFLQAARKLDIDINLIAYELDSDQPVSLVAKVISGLSWSHRNLYSQLIDIVDKYNVVHVISCVDPALAVAARLNSNIANAHFSSTAIETCINKIKFQDFCEQNKIKIIPKANGNTFPIFAKPSLGSASIGAQIIRNQTDLKRHEEMFGPLVLQKILTGNELTVDCFITKSGDRYASPRVRLATAGGEVTDTELVEDRKSQDLSLDLLDKLNFTGPVTVQIKLDENGDRYIMECNPRYGGGVLCTFAGGWHYPTFHCADIFGIKLPSKFERKLIRMKRYNKEVYYAVNH